MMKQKGFTLIEVILIIVVMAIAIPSLISAVSFMNQGQVNTIGTTTASNLARERMEEIIADKQNSARGFGYITNANYGAEAPVTGFLGYNRSVSILCVTPANLDTGADCLITPTDYKRVQVTVQASGIGPSVPDAVLVTLLTDY